LNRIAVNMTRINAQRKSGGAYLQQEWEGFIAVHTQVPTKDCKFFFWGGSFNVWGTDIFRVLLYCYSLLAMSTVSVTEYTNIVLIK